MKTNIHDIHELMAMGFPPTLEERTLAALESIAADLKTLTGYAAELLEGNGLAELLEEVRS